MSEDDTHPGTDAQLRALLTRAVEDLPVCEPPPIAYLQQRQQRRAHVTVLASVSAVMLVVLAVAGLSAALGHKSTGDPPSPATGAGQRAIPRITVGDLASYRWRSLPAAPIASRSDAAAVWTGRELIVWGGDRGDQQLTDGAEYNPTSRTWTKLPAAPLSPRAGALATWIDHYMLIWGAFPNPANEITDGARYDPVAHTWQRLPAVGSAPGYSGGQLVTAGSVAVLLRYRSGYSASTAAGVIVRADAYDPHANVWHRLPDFTAPRTHQVEEVDALGVGDSVFLWSSWAHTIKNSPHSTTTSFGTDAARLTVTSRRGWTPAATRPDSGLSARNPQWTGNSILLPQNERYCGGCAGPPLSATSSVLIDPVNGRRTAIPALPGPATQVISTGGAILDIGGAGESRNAHRSAAFDPVSGQWHILARSIANTQFANVNMWTGHQLIQWGDGDAPASQPGIEFARP